MKVMSKQRIITAVIYVVFFTAILGIIMLPAPYSRYASVFWMAWFALMGGYGASIESKKSKVDLLKNVVLVALGIAAARMLFYGGAVLDESGYVEQDGFEATHEQRCVQGVHWFLRIAIGGSLGVLLAFAIRDHKSAEEEESSRTSF